MKVDWTEPALEDLAAIQAYIAKDSSFYARQFIERIFISSLSFMVAGICWEWEINRGSAVSTPEYFLSVSPKK